jgi:hypothetical protein
MRLPNTQAMSHKLVDRATFCISERLIRSERDSNSTGTWEPGFRRPPQIASSGLATRFAFPSADTTTIATPRRRVGNGARDYFVALPLLGVGGLRVNELG